MREGGRQTCSVHRSTETEPDGCRLATVVFCHHGACWEGVDVTHERQWPSRRFLLASEGCCNSVRSDQLLDVGSEMFSGFTTFSIVPDLAQTTAYAANPPIRAETMFSSLSLSCGKIGRIHINQDPVCAELNCPGFECSL